MSQFYDSLDADYYLALSDNYKPFNLLPITNDDLKKSLIVANDIIRNYEEVKYKKERDISFGDLLSLSIEGLFKIGLVNPAKKALALVNDIQYVQTDVSSLSSFVTNSMAVQSGTSVAKKCVSVFVPETITLSSTAFLSHEFAHIIKEENPNECKGINTNLEVVPILIELITADLILPNPEIIHIERDITMYHEAVFFKRILKELKNEHTSQERKVLITALGTSLVYLNSFYYAMILYNIYLDDNEFVLALINKVLNKELTTFDVIVMIDDVMKLGNDSYATGFKEFKNRLK